MRERFCPRKPGSGKQLMRRSRKEERRGNSQTEIKQTHAKKGKLSKISLDCNRTDRIVLVEGQEFIFLTLDHFHICKKVACLRGWKSG